VVGVSYANADGSTGKAIINAPWVDFVTTAQSNGSGIPLLAGTNVYVWRNNDSRVDECRVGMHQ
jgi:formylmethanofuran dehydrogenase subunit D